MFTFYLKNISRYSGVIKTDHGEGSKPLNKIWIDLISANLSSNSSGLRIISLCFANIAKLFNPRDVLVFKMLSD